MCGTSERLRQLGVSVASRRVELSLGEKETVCQISTTEVSVSEISANEVGRSQVCTSEVSGNQVSTSQVGSSQISTSKLCPHEVGASEVPPSELGLLTPRVGILLLTNFVSNELAYLQEKFIDPCSKGDNIQLRYRIWAQLSEALDLVECVAELTMDRTGRLQGQRFGYIPEQLLKLLHDPEHVEHLLRRPWVLPPIATFERDLRNLLPRAEAVIHGTTSKTEVPEVRMDAATEVWLQVAAGLSGVFVDGKVCRRCERQRDTA